MNAVTEDTAIYHNGRTYSEHCAWLDSLTGDDYRMIYLPSGHLQNLAYVAYFKYALLNVSMTADQQIKFLDCIAGMVYGPVTAEAIEAIQPACATAIEMLHELNKIHLSQRCRAFEKGNMFRILAELNPSLLTALRLCQFHGPVPDQPRRPAMEACT
jgi:hypothetical protein